MKRDLDLDRRQILTVGGLSLAAAAVSGCAKIASTLAEDPQAVKMGLPPGKVTREVRLLNRLGFGYRPGDVSRVRDLGARAYVEAQLAAAEDEPLPLKLLISSLDIFSMGASELKDFHRGEVLSQLQRADLMLATYSKNQLLERLTDFWINHFNVYALKGDATFALAGTSRMSLRANALGKFPDLLRASAHSPSMLGYLDNTENRSGVPNENYARELLELHTLGVHGGYTQRDVSEVARCFTGWTVEDRFLHSRGRFRFDPDVHDDGAKTVLGRKIPAGGGEADGDFVLNILAAHPSTARHISAKLCSYFWGTDDSVWTSRLAKLYLATGGDIRQMLQPLLSSDDLVDGPPISKRPLDFVVSALRACGAQTDCGQPILNHLANMGQSSRLWPMPDGYPLRAEAWAGSMLGRWNFAAGLANGQISGTSVDLAEVTDPLGLILARREVQGDRVGSRFRKLTKEDSIALCLSSPEFQWR